MKNLIIVLFLLFASASWSAVPKIMRNDVVKMGIDGSTSNKEFIFDTGDGVANPSIIVDQTLKDFNFNKNVTTTGNIFGVDLTATGTSTFGSGADADVFHNFDIGAGGSNPYFGWSTSAQALVFNNGITEQKFGSGSGGGGTGVNFLKNPSFEDAGSPILNWTNSGGTFSQETHTNGREGNEKFARFVSTIAAEYFESEAVTISDDVNGGCMADFKYNQGDTAFDYKVLKSPYADPADVISEGSVSDLTDFLKAPTITFPCKGGDLLKLKIVSTGAGTIDVDETYLGSNKGFIDYDALNSFTARIQNNGSASVISDGGISFIQSVNRTGAGDVDIVFTPGFFTVIPGITPGMYASNANGNVNMDPVGVSVNGFTMRTTDGATLTDYDFDFTATKQGADAAKTLPAWNPEQADFFISANIGGAEITGVSNSTPTILANAGLDMVLNHGSARIPCVSNPSTGLTCSAGNEVLGINFNAPLAGKYKVCLRAILNSTSGVANIRLSETGNSDETIVQQGVAIGGVAASGAATSLCEYFTFNSIGEKTIKAFYEASAALTVRVDRNAAYYDQDANITVELVGHNVSRPIIQNMVDTNLGSGLRIQACEITNSGTPTVVDTNGSCSSWITSLTDIGVGLVGFNIKVGAFSSIYWCGSTSILNNNLYTIPQTMTTSLVETNTRISNTGVLQDVNFTLACIGRR